MFLLIKTTAHNSCLRDVIIDLCFASDQRKFILNFRLLVQSDNDSLQCKHKTRIYLSPFWLEIQPSQTPQQKMSYARHPISNISIPTHCIYYIPESRYKK